MGDAGSGDEATEGQAQEVKWAEGTLAMVVLSLTFSAYLHAGGDFAVSIGVNETVGWIVGGVVGFFVGYAAAQQIAD